MCYVEYAQLSNRVGGPASSPRTISAFLAKAEAVQAATAAGTMYLYKLYRRLIHCCAYVRLQIARKGRLALSYNNFGKIDLSVGYDPSEVRKRL